jgi:hypothetical protein
MDILYYSNYCKHSKKILQVLAKLNVIDKINFICIDKRNQDEKSGKIIIYLENGKTEILPPNIHVVPCLLLPNDKYRILLGDEILNHFETVVEKNDTTSNYAGEPMGFIFQGFGAKSNIMSEQYTFYGMSPEELSAKGSGMNRQMHNYVKSTHEVNIINAPQETYNKSKMSEDINISTLEEKRNNEIPKIPINI